MDYKSRDSAVASVVNQNTISSNSDGQQVSIESKATEAGDSEAGPANIAIVEEGLKEEPTSP